MVDGGRRLRAARACAGLVLIFALAGCDGPGFSSLAIFSGPSDPPPATVVATFFLTATPAATSTAPPTPAAVPTPAPGATFDEIAALQAGWRLLRPGLEFNQARVSVGEYSDWLLLLRADPKLLTFRVRYAPDSPLRVREWHAAASPEAVINGGFFDADNQATGLVIADGNAYGYSYRGFGGMFFVRDDAPDLVWLALEGYRPDPRISQAVQGYPMLVSQGQAIDSFPEDGKRNRRSFIGIDRAGRVFLGVTTAPVWTLTELAGFLAGRSGLEVDRAVNLDGGASSGLWVNNVPEVMLVDSFDPVPAVITIDAR